jgi:hypothetical protein
MTTNEGLSGAVRACRGPLKTSLSRPLLHADCTRGPRGDSLQTCDADGSRCGRARVRPELARIRDDLGRAVHAWTMTAHDASVPRYSSSPCTHRRARRTNPGPRLNRPSEFCSRLRTAVVT